MANTTSFEELKEFETFTSAFSGQEGESGTMDVDESVDEGGRLLALARARFAAGPGETGSGAVTTDTKESITVPIDFDLYKSFWGIQVCSSTTHVELMAELYLFLLLAQIELFVW